MISTANLFSALWSLSPIGTILLILFTLFLIIGFYALIKNLGKSN